MRKVIAYITLAGAVGMLLGIGSVLLGKTISPNLFIVGAVACFAGELFLKYAGKR